MIDHLLYTVVYSLVHFVIPLQHMHQLSTHTHMGYLLWELVNRAGDDGYQMFVLATKEGSPFL